MKCPNCNGEIKLGEKYCGRCGNPVPMKRAEKTKRKPERRMRNKTEATGKKESQGKMERKVSSCHWDLAFCVY